MADSFLKRNLNDAYYRLLQYTFRYWKQFLLAILGMIAFALTQPAFAALMEPLLNGALIDKDPHTIRWIPVAIVAIFIVRAIAQFISTYGMTWVGRNVIKELRNDMFRRLMMLPNIYFDSNSTGNTISKFTYDVEQVASATTTVITTVVQDGVMVIGLLAWMFYLNPKFAAVFLILGPAVAWLVSLVSNRIRRISRRIQQSMGTVSHVVEEAVQAQRVVKIFGGQDYEIGQFDQSNEHNRKQYMKLEATNAASMPVIQVIVSFALASIIYYATLEGVKNTIDPGQFIAFMTAMMMLFEPIKRLTRINTILQRGIAAAESVFDLLDAPEENDAGTHTIDRVGGDITYRNVRFCYPENPDKCVLNNIDLDIKAGQTVAFVGRSGSGKSTLVNLLPRLYDTYDGEIAIDGQDIKAYTLTSLRDQISYVGQEIVMFNDTLAHNIAYGRLHDVTEEEIMAAAKAAHAMEFIDKMPKGLQTMVGEKGVMLSGGQRQRIAIARALLKNAPILIMDEATSALDTESERYIQDALETLLQNRTTLVIAHRLSTIEHADKIVVMDQGHIVEAGNHHQLIQLDGHYADLHRLQFSAAS